MFKRSSNDRKIDFSFVIEFHIWKLRIQCFIDRPLTLILPVFAIAVKLISCLRIFCIFFCIFNFRKNRYFYFRLFSYKCF